MAKTLQVNDAKSRQSAAVRTPSGLSQEATRDITGSLNALLADFYALYFKTKNFHWHMSGPHFRDYHLLLDEQAEQIFDATDDIAERVRKVGGNTLHSVGESNARPAFSITTPNTSRRRTCWPNSKATTPI